MAIREPYNAIIDKKLNKEVEELAQESLKIKVEITKLQQKKTALDLLIERKTNALHQTRAKNKV